MLLGGRIAVVVLLVVFGSVVTGCTGAAQEPAARWVLRERIPEYRGISFDSTVADVIHAFGPPGRFDADQEGYGPLGTSQTDLPSLPAKDQVPPLAPEPYYGYHGVAFLTARQRVRGMVIWDRRAATARGVRLGDSSSTAAKRYPQLLCADTKFSETENFHFCNGQAVPHTYIWFGGDPVNVIVVLDRPIPMPPT